MIRILAACLATMLAIPATPVSAAVGYTYEKTALRAGPSRQHKVIAYIPEGDEIDMSNCKNGWCRVRWNGKSGYASYGSIDYQDDYEDCVYFGICF
jgi:uncharacterized protein YraI